MSLTDEIWVTVLGAGRIMQAEADARILAQREAHLRRCAEIGHYLLAGVCVRCGWHRPGDTLLHADFAADPECEWCTPPKAATE